MRWLSIVYAGRWFVYWPIICHKLKSYTSTGKRIYNGSLWLEEDPMFFWWMAAIFDVRHTQTSDYICTNLVVLPDPKNMGMAVEISLLSCILAEIYVTSCVLPVNGRHIWFPTFPYMEQHPYLLLRVLWHWKHVIIVEIVLLTCILAERHVITLFQPSSWISDFIKREMR